MEREDAVYHKLLIMSCLDDGYDEWLNRYLAAEDPLSDIVLELAYCGSDRNKTISVLHHFCVEGQYDMAAVGDRIRRFFRRTYDTKELSKEEILAAMQRIVANAGNQNDLYCLPVWASMDILADYYQLAKQGIISWERFDFAFFSYLNNGTPVDSDLIWKREDKNKRSLLDRMKELFRR